MVACLKHNRLDLMTLADLMTRLPDYMVPSLLIGLDEFPLTASARWSRSVSAVELRALARCLGGR